MSFSSTNSRCFQVLCVPKIFLDTLEIAFIWFGLRSAYQPLKFKHRSVEVLVVLGKKLMVYVFLHFRVFPSIAQTCKVSNLLCRKLTQTSPGLASLVDPVSILLAGESPTRVGWMADSFYRKLYFVLSVPHITLPLQISPLTASTKHRRPRHQV